jgi:DNA polymerase-1
MTSTKRRRIYLLDASTYIFRAYYSTRGSHRADLTTAAGLPTNALLVFTHMFRRLVRRSEPSYFACVFDAGAKSFRNDRYPLYKANRSETPEDLIPQFPYFGPIVEALGFQCIQRENYEADDVIATLARQAQEQGWEAVIISSDKDLYQLLGEQVHLYDTMKERWADQDVVLAKFGVEPGLVTQVQGLIGDAVDNIPGVPGVGPKTAAKLITEHGSIEGVYEAISQIRGKLQERLINHREDAFLSRELATLITDLELDKSLEDFAVTEPDHSAAVALFEELEFRSLLREFDLAMEPSPVSGEPQNASSKSPAAPKPQPVAAPQAAPEPKPPAPRTPTAPAIQGAQLSLPLAMAVSTPVSPLQKKVE